MNHHAVTWPEHRTLVDSRQFDQLLAALDEPPRIIPELLEAMQKRSRG
jgi:uncharacterized protein (DUF1778 family)